MTNFYGFRPYGRDPLMLPFVQAASQTIAVGDLVTLDSAGRVVIGSTGKLLGAAATPNNGASAGETIWVYCDPDQIFKAQQDTSALVDPYSAMTLTASADFTATSGAQTVTAIATSSNDQIQPICPATDGVTGEVDGYGTPGMILCKINRAKHCLGGVA